jgi:hypothetical protein
METAVIEALEGSVINPNPKYGFVIEYKDDNVIKFLKDLLEADAIVHSARKKFKVENREYDKGTLLLRLEDNAKHIGKLLDTLAKKHSTEVIGVNTALAESGADLGGGEFRLLQNPKVGFLVGQRSSMYNFGELWYLLDSRIELKTSVIYLDNLRYHDLRKYNVLILPSAWGSMTDEFDKAKAKKIKTWVEEGGTLIAIEGAAAALADSSVGISNLKLRRSSLNKLNDYYKQVSEKIAIADLSIDSVKIWESDKMELSTIEPVMKIEEKEEPERDKGFIKFMPQGAILNTDLDEDHWLSNGLGKNLPVFYSSSYSFFAVTPVEVAVRFENPEDVRLSGLLWHEAKHRLSYAAYLLRERLGRGQIISFAETPFFRAQYHGSGRLFLNAVFLGPGLGANQPVEF